ncbi:hypothetical protein ACWCPQ_16880 [Nocardia sp. NPDC001965]
MTTSAAASSAIDAVLAAIEQEAKAIHGPASGSRLEELARTLDSLTSHVHTKAIAESTKALAAALAAFGPFIKPGSKTHEPVNECGPQVVEADPEAVATLDGYGNETVVEFRDGSIWHKSDGWWWTTGSDTSLTSSELAACGSWRVIRAR